MHFELVRRNRRIARSPKRGEQFPQSGLPAGKRRLPLFCTLRSTAKEKSPARILGGLSISGDFQSGGTSAVVSGNFSIVFA